MYHVYQVGVIHVCIMCVLPTLRFLPPLPFLFPLFFFSLIDNTVLLQNNVCRTLKNNVFTLSLHYFSFFDVDQVDIN